ncbi:trypsin-like serine protease [Bifidobacterium adolescentis]|uniref:Possible DO serine protease n=1 Tax=Bifidobacterium adolescentis (strain ATCC 15703 / DSM 20083 / NCTC 11814 / E194a) TaxID=367928 RepID=A0ZZF5_BIFAA|nr:MULTISPECIES: trypsin-like peptidase domain-containing protein [Bifidobacterium]MCT6789764.1 trypsin-like peptidase domain-containing protein [Bifidobacterium adolescentis]NRD15429.1 trypsin-like peptidase domain-containing protein [Bifidobacterium adolescentis]OSG99720.1 trypsin-like serine protease [Bifidobacterium adolescentis]UYT25316.1 trypsin-like peptidase domain-containing protein [Bifidobacterium sp. KRGSERBCFTRI]SPU23100.1 DO serine protease [Bifidobacterium adolescentis]
MAEDNSDQNIAQPQDGTQQTAPQTPSENVADEAQTSVTEPIAVPNAGEQPTTALPTVDAADGTAGNTADDTPDYASAAGERTVINNATQDAPTEQYRPAPEYGAYGPVPTPPAGDASGQTVQQPQYGAQQQGQRQPQDNRPSFFGAFGNPYTTGNQRNNGNPFGNPFGGSSAQNGAQQNNQQQPQYGANMPPAGPGNRNPFGAPGQGFPNQPNQTPVVTKQKSGMTSHVVTAVVAALVSGALCLGVGFTAITNGWVHVPSSSSLSDVKSNTSGSGSAKAKSGTAVDWTAVAKEVSDSVVAIDVATSDGEAKGSGVVISDKGYIATNNHVISGAQQIQVTLASGAVYSAKVVGTDTTTDLAVIKLDNPPSDLKVAEFADSDNLAVGEAVMAIGNPLGYDDTATTGIVSALNRPVTVTDDDNNAIVTNAVQIDAAINPGNSGGPTFNAAGQVIGINSSIASTASSSGTAGSIGIGFAIPANLVKRVTNEIIDNGSVKHVVLGITIKSSSVEADGVTRGCAQVQAVTDGGPASKAGVKAGDSIVAFNGKAVNNNYSLLGYVRASAMGDKVKLTVVRGGNTMDLEVTLDQEETKTNSSNKQEQRQQNNGNDDNGNGQNGGSQNGQNGGNGNNGDGGGLFDPFGLW